MYLNLFHRTSSGLHYPILREQQQTVHDLGLKATLFLHYADLFDDRVLADARADHAGHGDEIGLALHDVKGPGLEELQGKQPPIWLYDRPTKERILGTILARWREVFGADPVSAASYHFDSSSLEILKRLAPAVQAVVGGCFEEGVRVFHGCNHSWYLFNEGMPWNPWYPSRSHSLRPAQNAGDAVGLVAVPHLVRDMSLSYEGRNDFWASHPPNVIRGMGNDASFCPYDLNLIDQYRMQEDWNGGYSYLNSFVSTAWLTWNHNSEYPPEVAWRLYRNMLEYLAQLKESGAVVSMTLAEYAAWHRENRPYAQPETYLAKEMLYASGKHYFWFIDGAARYLLDPTQGGSIGDLRPYAGKVAVATGPDTPHREIASYPYLVQSQYRTGFANHFEDGARTTLMVTHDGETLDLAAKRTQVAAVEPQATETRMTLAPLTLTFRSGLQAELVSTFTFAHNTGSLLIRRELTKLSDPNARLVLTEYFKGAPGKTEYAEDLHGIELSIDGESPCTQAFTYSGQRHLSARATQVLARFPQTNCTLTLKNKTPAKEGALRQGHLFAPYVQLELTNEIQGTGETQTWLMLSPITA